MTETEWLTSAKPEEMFLSLLRKAGHRKRRLFAVACCRRVWHLMPDDRSRSYLLLAEQFADGLAGRTVLNSARDAVYDTLRQLSDVHDPPQVATREAIRACWCAVATSRLDMASVCPNAADAVRWQNIAESHVPDEETLGAA